jgi:tRNA-dihydrouridine synthase A
MSRSTPRRGTTRPVSVAPMMQRTDRHFRVLMRQITRETLLYTEMLTANAILRGDRSLLLDFNPVEHPIALQLGGDDPQALAEAAHIGADWGYDEINLNVGCPSNRVQTGCFGASLMRRPERVAEIVAAMRAAVSVPITVKHRIGVDELDRYEDMAHFVTVVRTAEADRFSVHARKAWLDGLSPKDNRTIPPLRYDDVYRLKAEFPELVIEINGGITSLDEVATHLEHVDAVMIGRAAYDDPMLFAEVDSRMFDTQSLGRTRVEIVEAMLPYIEEATRRPGTKLHHVSRHMLSLFKGCHGGRNWRRLLSENTCQEDADWRVVDQALSAVRPQASAA